MSILFLSSLRSCIPWFYIVINLSLMLLLPCLITGLERIFYWNALLFFTEGINNRNLMLYDKLVCKFRLHFGTKFFKNPPAFEFQIGISSNLPMKWRKQRYISNRGSCLYLIVVSWLFYFRISTIQMEGNAWRWMVTGRLGRQFWSWQINTAAEACLLSKKEVTMSLIQLIVFMQHSRGYSTYRLLWYPILMVVTQKTRLFLWR